MYLAYILVLYALALSYPDPQDRPKSVATSGKIVDNRKYLFADP